jgi:hypothetical protein
LALRATFLVRRGGRPYDDQVVAEWAQSKDRWWRRAALVSTVPLNVQSPRRTRRHPPYARRLCSPRRRPRCSYGTGTYFQKFAQTPACLRARLSRAFRRGLKVYATIWGTGWP